MMAVRTEHLSMNLASKGLKVRMHCRNKPLGNGSVDLLESSTNDPTFDVTVPLQALLL